MDNLGHDFWTTTLPNALASSASKSPALMAYLAALNILDAEPLLSTGSVRTRLDPAVTSRKGIERHHIFPKAYLKRHAITETKRVNQIANMALVEWSDNITISDKSPSEYWPAQVEQKGISTDRLSQQRYWHALPDGWQSMRYDEFLEQRRRLMAKVVRDAFTKLSEDSYAPSYPRPEATTDASVHAADHVELRDLVDADVLPEGTGLVAVNDPEIVATVLPDGRVSYDGVTYDTATEAASAANGATTSGWAYWTADRVDGRFHLATLREMFANSAEAS